MTVIDNVAAYKQTAENHLIHFYARLQAKVHDAKTWPKKSLIKHAKLELMERCGSSFTYLLALSSPIIQLRSLVSIAICNYSNNPT
jgi:hypothetical protein